jgi:hypothetical protein
MNCTHIFVKGMPIKRFRFKKKKEEKKGKNYWKDLLQATCMNPH